MPNTTPTNTDTPKAMTTEAVVTMVFHSAVRAMSQARKKPKAIPRRPPPTEISTDLSEELADDVETAGSDGAANADFARALHDGGEHDVHDADTTDQERDGRDGHHYIGEDCLGALLLRQERGGNGDGEILDVVVGGIEDGGHDLGNFDAVGVRTKADFDAIEIIFHGTLESQKRYWKVLSGM